MNIFKEIKDFEGLYEIDNNGNVKSIKSGIILKPRINKCGYYYLTLCKNGIQYTKTIHRLVAKAFLPNPLGLPCVNHRDENKLNNFVWINDDGSVDYEKSNLEWCTYKYNSNYGTATQRMSAKKRGKKLSEEHKRKLSERLKGVPNPKVAEALRGRKHSEETKRKMSDSQRNNIKKSIPVVAVKDNNVVYEFASTNEAHRNGFAQSAVSMCCNSCYIMQGNNFFKGYHWYFKDEWLAMQKQIASPHRREDAIQLELNFL